MRVCGGLIHQNVGLGKHSLEVIIEEVAARLWESPPSKHVNNGPGAEQLKESNPTIPARV